jgi:diguanylate cyclase (GGDEF)-like protein
VKELTKNKNKSLNALISKLLKRIPVTLKMVAITIVVGLIMSGAFDLIQTQKLKSIFQSQLTERLGKQAMEDRLNFDRHIKAYLHSVKLFVSQRKFNEYIGKQKWTTGDTFKIKKHSHSPEWYPKSSILRTFVQPRFALLLDAGGNLREVYQTMQNGHIPQSLLQPTEQLLLKSYRQHYITDLDGKPYLIASERYVDVHGKVQSVLMLASPIDDIFLAAAVDSTTYGHLVALLTAEEAPRILMSSDLAEMPVHATLESLREHYLVTGQELVNYGASEQTIIFASFISRDDVKPLIQSITSSERQLRIIALPVLIITFSLLMFWVTRRIQLLTQRISDFSYHSLGVQSMEMQKGDQLHALEERFQRLTEEVLEARDVIQRESEERLIIEKKNMEIRQKEKQLELLQSVTQATGVGVIRKTLYGLEAANQQMEQFAEVCGGLSYFNIENVNDAERTLLDKNGDNRIFHVSCPDIFKNENIILVRDITKIKEQAATLEHRAMHDSLTGLPNRALLHDRIQQAIFVGQREEKSLALLMMDLDHFKEINDTLGHHIGDLVLKEVGARLPGILRKSDTIARLGGDEFAVVLPATDAKHAKETANKLLNAIDQPFKIEGHSLYVGASIGIVFSPDHGEDADVLLQHSDEAMYVAKQAQCGLSIYSPEQDQYSMQQRVLMGELRCAIENEELSLYYQPIVNFKTGNISGLEALTRWNHPEHGFIPPDEFIPLAEASGLINSLTQWVLKTALEQYIEWRREGIEIDISISINLSARNLQDSQFPDTVNELLKAWNIEPSCLKFEITEKTMTANPEHTLKVFKQLDAINVGLSIDDFGTGHSSLVYLNKLPEDEIKIDNSFVVNMTEDENYVTIVRSIIDLAHNLGFNVVAEGVECEDICKTLKEINCDAAQGHYFCQPLPAEDFIQWLCKSKWGLEKKDWQPDFKNKV